MNNVVNCLIICPLSILWYSYVSYWKLQEYLSLEASHKLGYTLGTEMFALGKKQLESKIMFKISTQPCYPRNFDWFSGEWSNFSLFFLKKKIQNGQLKNTDFFKIANSQYFFAKKSWIGPWVSKGQFISKCPLGVIVSTKKPTKFF